MTKGHINRRIVDATTTHGAARPRSTRTPMFTLVVSK
jgi:hypothetical protein